MKHKQLYFTLLFILSTFSLKAGIDPVPGYGGRAIGLGYAYVGVGGDFWSMFHNPAGIANVDRLEMGLFVEQRFGLSELTYGSGGLILPMAGKNALGLQVGSFGFDAYRENQIGISYGTGLLDIVRLGARVNYGNLSIAGLGSANAFMVDIGMQVDVSPEISLGFSAINVNRPKIESESYSEPMPSVLTLGIAFTPSENVMLVLDAQKDVDHPTSIRAGVEYKIIPKLTARIGMATEALRITGGLGLNLSNAQIDLAFSYHETLGLSPHISVNYAFNKKKQKQI